MSHQRLEERSPTPDYRCKLKETLPGTHSGCGEQQVQGYRFLPARQWRSRAERRHPRARDRLSEVAAGREAKRAVLSGIIQCITFMNRGQI